MGLMGCPEMSVRNYRSSLCNNPKDHSSQPCQYFGLQSSRVMGYLCQSFELKSLGNSAASEFKLKCTWAITVSEFSIQVFS